MHPYQDLFHRDLLPGRADPEGTAAYFAAIGKEHQEYLPELWYRTLPASGWSVSRLGSGTYRTLRGVPSHFNALREALNTGSNVVDTSGNYGDGSAESLLGDVLRHLIHSGRLTRNQVVLVSKAGYIQGRLLSHMRSMAIPPGDIVRYGERLWHCIHPDCIRMQLELTLRRIGIQTLDLFLLHNPEYYLYQARRENVDPDLARREYLERIGRAMEAMEELVTEGKIQYWGISSNTFAAPPNDPFRTPLPSLLEMATDHFLAVQFPANLLENSFRNRKVPGSESGNLQRNARRSGTGGTAGSQGASDGESLCDTILRAGLWSMGNRPLHALSPSGHLVRLAREKGVDLARSRKRMENLRVDLHTMETRLLERFGEKRFTFDSRTPSLSALMEKSMETVQNTDHYHALLPSMTGLLQRTVNRLRLLSGSAADQNLVENYIHVANALLSAGEEEIRLRQHLRLEGLERELRTLTGREGDESLAGMAVSYLLAEDCPDTILVGMRNSSYVHELHGLYGKVPPPPERLRKMEERTARYVESLDQPDPFL